MFTRTIGSLTPGKIAGIYLLFGFGWIVATDYLLYWVVESAALITALQIMKGFVFVAVSGILIFWLTDYYRREQQNATERLEVATEQLQVLQRLLRHNLRNDLNVVLSRVELVERGLDDEGLSAHLQTVKDQVAHVIQLSNRMHVAGALDLTTDHEETVDLTTILTNRLETLEASGRVGTVDTDIPESVQIRGNWTLEHAIDELLDNAVTHHPAPVAERTVAVDVEERDESVRLEIRDNGHSIPPSELEALEAGNETDLVHMSGIGLWIAKWLCEYHGGAIEFEDREEGGTCVRLTFEAVTPTPAVDRVAGTVGAIDTPTSA